MPTATIDKTAVTVDAAAFAGAVGFVAKVATKATQVSHRWIEFVVADGRLTIHATDGLRHRRETVDADGPDATFTLPTDVVVGFARYATDGDVALDVTDDRVTVTAGRRKLTLNRGTVDLPDFPAVSDDAPRVTVAGPHLGEVMKRIGRATSDDDTKVFAAVELASNGSAIRGVATDSYRLAYASAPADGDELTALVHGDVVSDIVAAARAADTVELAVDGKLLTFTYGSRAEAVGQHAGDFPSVINLMKVDGNTTVAVSDPAAFVDELRVAELTAPKLSVGAVLKLDFADGEATASSPGSELGEGSTVLPADVDGDGLSVHFTSTYLIEGLDLAGKRPVVIKLVDPLKPALIDGGTVDDVTFKYVVMPTRL